jgi:hypothetical protein
MQAPSEDKSNDKRERFYEKSERIFHQLSIFPKKMLLGEYDTKVSREFVFSNRQMGMRVHFKKPNRQDYKIFITLRT